MDRNTLTISLVTLDDKVKYAAAAPGKPEITIDYFPPVGTGEGYTSLELLLMSYTSCMSTALLALLRGMRKTIPSLRAQAKGIVREEHPKAFTRIELALTFVSPDLAEADVIKARALAEEKYCPVYAMLRGNVEIVTSYEITRP
ncbi:MAG TPA: OsmC family protein [Clostridia bacterium]|nr:OsmC family protein [Clostridia bacterium]